MKGEGSGNSPGDSQKAARLVEWNNFYPYGKNYGQVFREHE